MENLEVLPKMNMDNSETGCCPRFEPKPWDEKSFIFDNILFVKTTTQSIFHVPLNMGSKMKHIMKKIEKEDARADENFLMLSYDPSAWKGEHLISVTKDIPGEEMVKLSGTFLTKVFKGPFKNAKIWHEDMEEYVKSQGEEVEKIYFYYTTCPKCAKYYGENYVIGFAQVR